MHQNKIPPKRDFPVTLIIFWKLIKVIETTTIHFVFRMIHSKSTSKLCRFFRNQNCIEKVHHNDVDILFTENTSKETHRNDVDEKSFCTSILCQKKYVETTSYFVQRNYIEKVRWNVLKFVDIWSSTYRYNVNIKSTLNQRIVFIGQWPILEFILTLLLNLLNKNFIRSTCNVNRIRKN